MMNSLLKFVFWFIFVSVLFVYMPGIPPDAKFSSIKLPPTKDLENLSVHKKGLNNAKRLFVNKFIGPECLTVYDGELYFITSGNKLFKMTPSQELKFVMELGYPCDTTRPEPKCGRALALRFDKLGTMFVTHTQQGIWRYNLMTNEKKLLVSPSVPINGVLPKIFNSISLASNGDIYWSHTSSVADLENAVLEFLVDGTGRLLRYNAAKNESEVLLSELSLANGVAISPNEDFVVVAETTYGRLRKVYVKGPMKGQQEVFIEGLPGCPDNLQTIPDGSGILVSLILSEGENETIIFNKMASLPFIRKFAARAITLIDEAFIFLNKNYPHVFFERIINKVGSFESIGMFLTSTTALARVDWNGNIVDLWFCTDKSVMSITDAIVLDDKLYLGSVSNNYIGAVDAPTSLKSSYDQKQNEKTARSHKSENKEKKV